ncbi:hypothetical protein [Desulfitobacterium sp. AusDCA]
MMDLTVDPDVLNRIYSGLGGVDPEPVELHTQTATVLQVRHT